MNKFMRGLAVKGRKNAWSIAAVALMSMVSGCQSMDVTTTGSLAGKLAAGKPAVHAPAKKIHYVGKKRVGVFHRKSLMQTSSVTRTTETAYAVFVRPQRARIVTPAPMKVSYRLGGPFLGHSPWICGPSGFGQRAACRAR
ncbi:hypothetical protein [Mesorhizobium sp. B1-1-7]|uniref:hypothetical protein n=1 Tax=Mesorhizobium sp. B1-1-7 TaxID=2589977 RepID=UPI00112657A6|nr:hypothetical protein [Mesorhizobium sp. B1-1-7]TPN54220.1 hypothetical protein FJ978_09035 [Mesorhizobium sp. B1-1-7]TPN54508.1 hypothetical protein FJ976_09960 [Mesorhizobium sp. B1-1-9]